MYVCTYKSMYVCMYVCTKVFIYVCMYVHTYVWYVTWTTLCTFSLTVCIYRFAGVAMRQCLGCPKMSVDEMHTYTVVEITSGHRSISECFFKLTAHYSMWTVRVTDHVCMVVQQLCSQRYTRWKAGAFFQCTLLLSSVVYTFLVSRGSLTDC